MTYLVVCGFWVPWTTSLIWLTSLIVGALFQIVIYENIFLLVRQPEQKVKVICDAIGNTVIRKFFLTAT